MYRGGVKLNLSKFFRITGVVLVLVAAGLVMSTLRGAYEAGWLTVGQQTVLDLSAIARPGSVQESLLTGMLGIRSNLPLVEVIAYALYAVPMLLVVLWPPSRTPARPVLGRLLVATAAAALVIAGLLAAFAPAAPATITATQGPFALQSTVDQRRSMPPPAVSRSPERSGSPSPATRRRRNCPPNSPVLRSPAPRPSPRPATPTSPSLPAARSPPPRWPVRRSPRMWTAPPPACRTL